MQRRSYLALTGSALGAGLAGCSETLDPGGADQPRSTPTDSPAQTPTRTAIPTVESETFQGVGPQTTDRIAIQRPAVFIAAEHEGSGYFAIRLLNDEGERVSILANSRGQYDGQVARHLKPGAYFLDIAADGQWNVGVKRFVPLERGSTPSVSKSHAWPWVFGPFQSPGAIQVQFEGKTRTNYRVWKLANDASRQDLLFDEPGPTGRLSALFSGDSVFFVAIESHGEWDVTIGKP